ncbi:MAG: bifunctional oligoribonuclease/PAP phosphatase NrnA [Melioribacteraceae bacterium]|nr:bifunctional oligoribonuclease/PAP phosphatase NrnA [Melioribacteraceae bacterium]
MLNFTLLNKIIAKNNSFVITTHVNPDADAIGSEIALSIFLRRLNKEVRIINHSETPYFLKFLDNKNVIEKYDESQHSSIIANCDVIITLDLNALSRTVSMEENIRKSKALKVCIDHHTDPEDFTEYLFIDPDLSSTGEILFDFIKESSGENLDYDLALPIYAAILTDTGSFRFDRTTPRLHRITAELLEAGVNPQWVYREIYDQGKQSRIRLLGRALNSIKLDETGELAYMKILNIDLNETGADEADVDGFVNYCLSIKGVKLGILFFEMDDEVKISFRSAGNIPVNKLAAEFNGGGHINASGARVENAGIDELINKVLKSAEKYLAGKN